MRIESPIPTRLGDALLSGGYAFVSGNELAAALGGAGGAPALAAEWDDLILDEHLPGRVKYRLRRYGLFAMARDGALEPLPHRTFVQSADDIPTYGGRPREFAPLTPAARADPLLADLIRFVGREAVALWPGVPAWEVGVHMVRLVVAPGTAISPTPEGRHRDGHWLIGMHLIGREGCEGGQTLVYSTGGDLVSTATLRRPLDSLIVNDERVEHAVTDVTATDAAVAGRRDLLIVALYPPSDSEGGRTQT